MYDPFIFILLLGAIACLIMGYKATSIIKYPLLLTGAILLIVFGLMVGSAEGINQEVGANFQIVRDANYRVKDVNMLFAYNAINTGSSNTLFAIGNFAQYGGIIVLLLILADLSLHTYRGFKTRNL